MTQEWNFRVTKYKIQMKLILFKFTIITAGTQMQFSLLCVGTHFINKLLVYFSIWSLFEGTLNPPYESSAGKIQRPCTVVFQAGLMFNMLDLTETEQIYMSSSD